MKQYLVFYGPIDSFSGYGARSRDLVKSLINSDQYNIEIISCNWGSTPRGFLQENNPEHKKILDRIISGNLSKQPDIWIMNTVPNEMQKVGKYNILITAGIETTVCDPSWIDGCNKADLVLVSSNHAKKVFENSKFEERHNQSQQIVRKIELTSPIEVLFEGVDLNTFFHIKNFEEYNKEEISEIVNDIEEDFCFLFVGHWLPGDLGQDRKDVGGLVKTFLETFKNKKRPPALILKTSSMSYSILDRDIILNKINQIQKLISGTLPNIYLLHGELSDEEMNILYNHPKVKCMVNFTKGEGYGRPLLEFSTSKKPIIVSNWSGHLDFLQNEFNILLPGQLTPVHQSAQSANMIVNGSAWFTVDYNIASSRLEEIWKSYKNYIDLGTRQSHRAKNFSLEKMSELLTNILNEKVPHQVELKLPDFKSIELPKIKMLE
jgi:hypothetical protein